MVLSLGLEHSRQATAAQSAVTNMTNELLQKNADMLKMGTIETAKEAERSVVDIQTLQHTNQQLISTLDEVMKIQQEGAQKRREAELELGRIEGKYPPYYGQDLELAYTSQRSVFTLWAPTASKTRLNIYSSGEGGNPEEQLEMEPSDDGTWRIAVERDLNGSFYTFQIEKEGKWLAETPGIWAKAVGINGDRAAVIDWNQT